MDYYFEYKGKRKGPYGLSELPKEKLSPDTLIWHEGLSQWTPAKEIKAVEELLLKNPPELPLKEKKEFPDHRIEAISGFVLLALSGLAIRFFLWEDLTLNQQKLVFALASLVNIFIGIYCYRLAKNLKRREPLGWGIFGFFLSGLALLVIAFIKRR